MLDEAWAAHRADRDEGAPTVVSLFAGCGGSSLGYSMAGFEERLAVEYDDHAAASFRLNFPGVTLYHGNICDLTDDEALNLAGIEPGALDVLDGSPPCQGFSTSGKRVFGDDRNQLYLQYIRLLQAFRPKTFVMENVSGMVKGSMKIIFAEALRGLKACGYDVSARLLDAQCFGVPQRRRRLIFIGVRNDIGVKPSHPIAQTCPFPVSMAIGDLGNTMNPGRGHVWIDESPTGRKTKNWWLADRARQGTKYVGQSRRDRWDAPAATLLTALTVKRPYLRNSNCHPLYTRTYSLLEYKRLATFPDAFQFPGDFGLGCSRVGNSVPPFLMRAIANHIRRQILSVTPGGVTDGR